MLKKIEIMIMIMISYNFLQKGLILKNIKNFSREIRHVAIRSCFYTLDFYKVWLRVARDIGIRKSEFVVKTQFLWLEYVNIVKKYFTLNFKRFSDLWTWIVSSLNLLSTFQNVFFSSCYIWIKYTGCPTKHDSW